MPWPVLMALLITALAGVPVAWRLRMRLSTLPR